MASIRDVAKLAGVSVSTVSKFFNNPQGLSEPYRTKVAAAVGSLNYTPNRMARGLRTRRTNTIAIVVPEITNTFYVEIYNGIREAALAQGYMALLYTTEENIDILSVLLDRLSTSEIDGIVLCFLDEDRVVSQLTRIQETIPVTLMSWDFDTQFNSVVLDLTKTLYQATKYLIERGHRKIAYVGGPEDSRRIISVQKKEGYLKAMAEYSLPVPDEYIYFGRYSYRTGYQGARKFMQCPDPPTAIVTADDTIAIGCCKYLNQDGFKIPSEVAVMGMDGIQLSKVYDPSITTMAIPISQMVSETVNMLLDKIKYPSLKNRQILFEPKLIVGRSTDEHAPLYLEF